MIRLGSATLTMVLLMLAHRCSGLDAAPMHPQRVLVLYSHRQVMPINLQWDRGIRQGIKRHLDDLVNIDIEYLDFERLQKREHRDNWVELLRLKYADSAPDVVIPVNDAASECVAADYPDLFPRAGVVFCSISQQTLARVPVTPRMTGVVYRLDFQGTLELARHLFPATRRMIVVGGFGEDDVGVRQAAQAAFAHEKQIQFTYWMGLPVDDLCAQAARVESGSIILFLSQIRDRDGRVSVISRDVAQQLAESSRVPVFGLYDTLLGTGVLGGVMAPVEAQGQRAGEIAARLLRGEAPADIPFSGIEMNRPMFDGRQLRRWGIRERELPEDSLVMFQEPTVWARYWAYLTAGGTTIGLQFLLIVALMVNRRKRRRAEHALADLLRLETMLSQLSSRFVQIPGDALEAEIEQAVARIVEHLGLDHSTVFLLSDDGRELQVNLSSQRPGEPPPPSAIALDSIPWLWTQMERGDLFRFSSVSDLPAEASREKKLMVQLGIKSGVAVALSDQGNVFGMIAFGLRTHEHRWDDRILQRLKHFSSLVAHGLARGQADKDLTASRSEARQLAGRLLTAQEDERRRLAREIHDDVSQRLAAITIQAGNIEQRLPATDRARPELTGLKERLISLAHDVQRISRQLHPAVLDDLGLSDAIRSECERLAEHTRLTVRFHCGTLPSDLPNDIALCLYRIAQEALWNVVKHADTDRADLTINADAESVCLEVRDRGCGFDVLRAKDKTGLGLASMKERVRLLGGNMKIESSPQNGTSIVATIPIPEDHS
jgi:signal transduction histidine kinase